ncbi:hypothetical protein HDA40_005440 [Hamadaea flava]|uniref:Lipoprotein n=1 Tax=Hamadaea flava TaxID=1742688 RepID=A0ABV8M0A9_9ACTN|nr:hypothetical protein [Hamadaea flava]MCP2326933.1 hypothetical protein [Hamadaea flava]
MKTTTGYSLALLTLASVIVAGCDREQAATPASPTATATSAAPSASPSSSPATRSGPKTIPAKAFLQKEDTRSTDGPAVISEPMLPPLCKARYASDAVRQVRQTRTMRYYNPGTPLDNTPDGTIQQTISSYTSEGGARLVAEIKAAVEACPQETLEGYTYTNRLLTGPKHGDESLLFERAYPTRDIDGKLTGGKDIRLIAVVRVGNVVTVLYETGWEMGWSAEPASMERLTAKAEQRMRAWLSS